MDKETAFLGCAKIFDLPSAKIIKQADALWRNRNDVVVICNDNTKRISNIFVFLANECWNVDDGKRGFLVGFDARELVVIEHLLDELAIDLCHIDDAVDFLLAWFR